MEPIAVTGFALDAARDWFTISPKERTTMRLAEHIQRTIDAAIAVAKVGQ